MTGSTPSTRRVPRTGELPGYIHHASFERTGADREFARAIASPAAAADYESRYMPDEVTRDNSKRMHYAAFRWHEARTRQQKARWQSEYFALRDSVVLGNRKLIYRAVRRQHGNQNRADDLIGDCHIVLIQAVAAFNPWLDIRFSTYAYTCLVRALSRLAKRLSSDRLARALSFDALPDGEPGEQTEGEQPSSSWSLAIDEFLRDDHPLLSAREKTVIARRFTPTPSGNSPTLEHVGRDMGLSKERVRQVQLSALGKLRMALAPAAV